jgi:processing peptidase subunit beta
VRVLSFFFLSFLRVFSGFFKRKNSLFFHFSSFPFFQSHRRRNDLKKYIDTNYVAPRMVVAAAGGVDHDELVKLAAKAFGKLPSGEGHASTSQLVAAAPAHFTGSEVRIRDPDMARLHFAVAFKGASWGDRDAVPLMVLQSMLGAWDKNGGAGGAASPLLAQRASANNLCDSYMAFNTNYHDAGLFGVYAVADPGGPVDDLAWAVMRDVSGLVYGAEAADVEHNVQLP